MSGVRRVIVGVSGSPASIRALRYAADFARGDEAALVAVLAWVPPGGDLADRRAPSVYMRQIWQRAASQRLLEALGSAWGGIPEGVTVERVVVRGQAGPALVEVADTPDDLLVVGAGARGLLARAWRGKVARYCLTRAQCPVLAVPPSPLAGQARRLHRWPFLRGGLTTKQVWRELPAPSPSDPRP